MFVEVHDLITGQYYSIGKQSICYFTKEINEAGCNVYYIVLNDKTKISVTHKRWIRIRNKIFS